MLINPLTATGFLNRTFLDFLDPPQCMICEGILDTREGITKYICKKCLNSIHLAPDSREIMAYLMHSIPADLMAISNIFSLFSVREDSRFMELIYSAKYYNIPDIGFELGKLLAGRIQDKGNPKYDFIVPVPIHHARNRERGYNQSDYIAEGLSDILKFPVNKKILKRKKYTVSQTKLSAEQRKTNLKKAFCTGKEIQKVVNKSILICDDVITTASTLNTCAMMLLESGARIIDAAAPAYAGK